MLDITKTTEPRSDQQNFDDYLAGPKRVTVAGVKKGSAEQPVVVHLVEFPGRPYKPSKSMRRVLLAAWGGDASEWAGRQLELYGDPEVPFGLDKVGGIKIGRMSHLDAPVTILLTVTRGRRAPHTVEPLTTAAPEGWEQDVEGCETVAEIQEFYEMASAGGWWSREVSAACTARKAALNEAGT